MDKPKGEYAQAGVDYAKIAPFKRAMVEVARKTAHFPERRNVFVKTDLLHAHGGVYEYRGENSHLWCQTTEGLGNKNWIAEWMAENAGTGKTYYEGIPIDSALMAVNDCIAQGALPVAYTDEVAAGDDDWFQSEKRAAAIGEGFLEVCSMAGMALVQGESPALKYLAKAAPPVKSAPSFSGCVVEIIDPAESIVTGAGIADGDFIIGITSSGLHANGISLVIKRALTLKEQFLTKLPTGRTLGDEALIPTRSYVNLIKCWKRRGVFVKALIPGTGGGVAKVAFDERPFTYRITDWLKEIPPLFLFMREIGVSIQDLLTTFNWGIGYYAIAYPHEAEAALHWADKAGYSAMIVGRVENGERKVIFEPEGITLPPPGD